VARVPFPRSHGVNIRCRVGLANIMSARATRLSCSADRHPQGVRVRDHSFVQKLSFFFKVSELRLECYSPSMPCLSFSANSTPNISGLFTLVQILRTRTLNVYFLSRKYPIEDLEYSWLQSPNIPYHKEEYLVFLKKYSFKKSQLFLVVASNIYTVWPWEGRFALLLCLGAIGTEPGGR
jgi:hypothetical protein